MTYLTRSKAAEYLSKHLPDKNSPAWQQFLNDNARTTRKPASYQVPFERDGLLAYYELNELEKFIRWRKRKIQQTTFKLPSRKVVAMSEAKTESSIEGAKQHIKRSITETDTHIIETTEHPDATITRRTPKAEIRIDEVQALKAAIETPITAKDSMPHTVDKVEGIWWRATATIHPIVENCDGSHTKAVIQFVTCEEPPRVYNLSRNDILALAGSLEAAYDVVLALSGEYAPHLH